MFYIIGTGPNTLLDIPLSTIPLLKSSNSIYLEYYTSIISNDELNSSLDFLQKFINRKIKLATRKDLESEETLIKDYMENGSVCLLVPGTPMFATTHFDLLLRLKEYGIRYKIFHNASIINVTGSLGLYSYCFGKTVSVPSLQRFISVDRDSIDIKNVEQFRERPLPFSVIENINKNFLSGLHCLILCDIRMQDGEVTEETKKNEIESLKYENKTIEGAYPSNEAIIRELEESVSNFDKRSFDLPNMSYVNNFMTANECIHTLLILSELSGLSTALNMDTVMFVVCRFGTDTEKIYLGTARNLLNLNFGAPLHSLVIPGKIDLVEKENLIEMFGYKF